jgi:hypothetical protein
MVHIHVHAESVAVKTSANVERRISIYKDCCINLVLGISCTVSCLLRRKLELSLFNRYRVSS